MPKMKSEKEHMIQLQQDLRESDLIAAQKEADKTIINDKITNPGLLVSSGHVEHNTFDTTEWNDIIDDITKMRNGDSVASTTLEVLKAPIIGGGYSIVEGSAKTEKSKQAAELVQWTIDNLYDSYDYFLHHALLMLDFGFILQEKVYKYNVKYKYGTINQIFKLSPIQFDTIMDYIYDDYMIFKGITHIKQVPNSGQDHIHIPADKFLVFTYQKEFDDVRGRPILRPSRVAWRGKQDVLYSMVRTANRKGIPNIITYEDNLPNDVMSKARQIGRTLTSNIKNSYVITQKDKLEVEMIDVQGQENSVEQLRFFNEEQFYNTMSQFMASGIGGNGSRAATGEHKTSYEMKVSEIIKTLERNINNQLVTDIIKNADFLNNLTIDELPSFQFNSISQVDLTKVATNIKTLVDSGMVLRETDYEQIREQFGLPQLETAKTEFQTCNHTAIELEAIDLEKNNKPRRELTNAEKNIFELQSAEDHFLNHKIIAEKTLLAVFEKAVKRAADKFEQSPTKEIDKNTFGFFQEFEAKMFKLLNQGYERGRDDLKKEVRKINSKTELVSEKFKQDRLISIKKRLKIKLNKLLENTRESMNDYIISLDRDFIKKRGGARRLMLKNFLDSQKLLKRDVVEFVIEGYSMGRSDEIDSQKNNIELLEYTAILDNNLCDNCAPLDGIRLSIKEAKERGLNVGQRGSGVNPDCLGTKDRCRCQLIPVG